jgi:hypothetical protein
MLSDNLTKANLVSNSANLNFLNYDVTLLLLTVTIIYLIHYFERAMSYYQLAYKNQA